jgi:hypothetical protein
MNLALLSTLSEREIEIKFAEALGYKDLFLDERGGRLVLCGRLGNDPEYYPVPSQASFSLSSLLSEVGEDRREVLVNNLILVRLGFECPGEMVKLHKSALTKLLGISCEDMALAFILTAL